MKVSARTALTLALLIVATAGAALAQREFYVALDGDDAAPGTAGRPFGTLEAARDAIRALKADGALPEGGVTVWIGPGTYYRGGAFELAEQDSGTAAAPITYRAHERGQVRLVGGRAVAGFAPVSDPAALARLPAEAREHVVQADLRGQGIEDLGELERRGFVWPKRDAPLEVSFRGEPMTLARWPNDAFLPITGVPEGQNGGKFAYEGDRPRRWADEPDIWVFGYWFQDWADSYERVAHIDALARIVTTEPPHGVYGYREGQRFYFLNVLPELDSPGEYYVDRQEGRLYVWPAEPPGEGDVVASMIPTLISVQGASHVTFRGLTLEACRGTAVNLTDSSHVRLAGCTIRNTGRQGVSISGGAGCGVIGCDIYETAEGAVSLDGGDRATLTPSGHYADNNRLLRFGRTCRTYSAGLHLSGVGQRASHNLVHDAPHVGILFGGNDHVIELNELHDLCYETGDVGAMYTGRDWTARGTVIRHNFIHHVSGPGRYGANGIYLDDAASGITVFGNVFYRVTRPAYVGGGRDNVYENNIFVDCEPALHVDARAMGWMSYHAEPDGTLQQRLRAVPYKEPPWSERYPRLVNILADEPRAPKGNLIARNIRWGGTWDDVEAKARPYLRFEDNLQDVDPRFVDAENMDFRLRDDSPAWQMGFRRIPFEGIGPYEDELRASWPVEHALRRP
ncbi:MAG: hypothetical protein AMK73_09470 [Planctomycetes bacterium SM23_32]|nr:MAG: hypothetical protein AMK73_09470 [Planctomycetes bacterium SM23_32]